MWMALISLAGVFIGAYLTLYKFGFIGTLACGASSCEQVQSSRYADFLGFPVATWGIGFYVTMLALSIAGMQDRFAETRGLSQLMLIFAGIGVVFTGYLNYLEAFVIHAWCMWCIISACLVLLLFVLANLDYRETKNLGVRD
jgi:uncharacterized membrane protein